MEHPRHAPTFFSGILVGALLTTAWFLLVPEETMRTRPSLTASSTSATVAHFTDSGAVAVSNQKAGTVVLIDSVTVPPPGVWVTVREIDESDLGNVLGAARARGPLSNLSIHLLRPTVPGQTYAVMLYRNEETDVFAVSEDSVYVDFATGQRVVALFKTFQ